VLLVVVRPHTPSLTLSRLSDAGEQINNSHLEDKQLFLLLFLTFVVFALLMPYLMVVLLQLALQQKILGVRFWKRHADRRIELSKGRFVPIAKFLELVCELF
jgi:amino acid transporter